MKVLVMGGSGFIGSHVADELSRRGYQVTIFDRDASPWITKGQKMLVGDMQDQVALTKAISNARYLYHFGGVADIDLLGAAVSYTHLRAHETDY